MKDLGKKWKIEVGGTTNASGKVVIKYDPNPYTREAKRLHEDVHKKTTEYGIKRYGRNTPEFQKWWTNPQNWAADEVKAYNVSVQYLEETLRR